MPLFNLEGTLEIHERPDGAEVRLVAGDLSPGRLTFTALPRAGGGSTLLVDAQVDISNSGWLIRKIIHLSPAGEPAALAAAAYVTVRAVALRAEHLDSPRANRPAGNAGAAARVGAVAARAGRQPSWRRCARVARWRWSRAPGRNGWRAWRSRRR